MKYVGLADAVREHITEQIMDGRLAPGTPLRIAALAGDAHSSQTPVREALARLEGTGLVKRLPMRGYIVAPPLTSQEVRDLTAVRSLIEPEIAALACSNGTAGLVTSLQSNQKKAREAPLGATYSEFRPYLEASSEFHQILAEACGNEMLANVQNSLPVHAQRFRIFAGEGISDADVSLREHQAILDAIRDGNPEEARQAMLKHVHAVGTRAEAEV